MLAKGESRRSQSRRGQSRRTRGDPLGAARSPSWPFAPRMVAGGLDDAHAWLKGLANRRPEARPG